jgi:hypothetical protein
LGVVSRRICFCPFAILTLETTSKGSIYRLGDSMRELILFQTVELIPRTA